MRFIQSLVALISLTTAVLCQEICKCGGQYANNRPVTGCVKETCTANAADSIRCVTINQASVQTSFVIGYDCVPWPKDYPSDCASFDDGSRLCVKDKCQQPTANQTDGCKVKPDLTHATIGVQLGLQGLNFGLDAARRIASDEVAKLKVPTQNLAQAGFNITISNIRVEKFVPPLLSYVLEPPSTVRVVAKGGDFKACATWSASLMVAPIISASGDLCVWSLNAKGVDAAVQIKTSVTPDGRIQLEAGTCKLDVPIDMKSTGFVGTMAQLAFGLIQSTINKKASTEFCKLASDAVKATVNTLLKELPTTFKVDERYGLNYTVRSMSVLDYAVKVQAAISATFDPTRRRTIED